MNNVKSKIPVAILGATGMVGQRFIALLENHPWFEVTCVAASANSAGQQYGTVVSDRWSQPTPIPQQIANMKVYSVADDMDEICQQARFVFCAIDAEKDYIQQIEEAYAAKGLPVVSNNSAHRWTDDVPMIMPEVNPDHLQMIDIQRVNRGWTTGLIVVKPNCSIQCYVPLLHAWKQFEPKEVIVSTYQAISGAGKTFATWPEMVDNVIPYIGGEEEKSEKEPGKIWANIKEGKFVVENVPVFSANCIRVPISDGHMAAVNVNFAKNVTAEELLLAITEFKNPLDELDLPSAPKPFLNYFEEDNRPQTKLDRNAHNGMSISIGRLRQDPILGWKVVALSHNTVRGAAGGNILNAELLVKKGYIS